MGTPGAESRDLELALLRRAVEELAAGREICARCERTPLIGEHVYVYASGAIACALCRHYSREDPIGSRLIHGPEFGHTIRITDRRAAA